MRRFEVWTSREVLRKKTFSLDTRKWGVNQVWAANRSPFALLTRSTLLFSLVHVRWMLVGWLTVATARASFAAAPADAEKRPRASQRLVLDAAPLKAPRARGISTIHWQGVPLHEAVSRLEPLFGERIFVDRRVDPSMRVDLDATASSAEQVLAAVAAERGLGVSKVGKLVYLGPAPAAKRLPALVNARSRESARLAGDARANLSQRDSFSWPRLAEPRQLVTSIVAACGWKLQGGEQIPHDLWDAETLPELSVADRLTVLLLGFDRTFELDVAERVVRIMPLPQQDEAAATQQTAGRSPSKANRKASPEGAKQVYTLRVQEKPVGAVLNELANRLHWAVQIDEEAIRAAGKSLDTRVSFSVENADREKLLDALLTPAGLECQIDGNQIRVMPQRY